jgi:nucleoside-diphosphate-sugar epimerase
VVDLVTGATGFIGGHLAQALLTSGEPSTVRVLCRPGSERKLPEDVRRLAELAPGDLYDRESLARAARGARRIFHCAGHVSDWGSLSQFERLNVRATRWLLESARAEGVERFIHLSSIAAFGTPAPEYFDDDSESCVESQDPYSRTKAEGERLVLEAARLGGLPATVLRPAVVYGPGGTWLEEPLRMIEQGKMFLLGGGRGTCHPCYIKNLVDAILLAAEHPRAIGRAYIVTDGRSIPFHAFFDSLAEIAGRGPIRRSIPLPVARAVALFCEAGARLRDRAHAAGAASHAPARPLLTRTAIAMVATPSRTSIERIRQELGFQPRYDFSAAMAELREWYAVKQAQAGRAPSSSPPGLA